MGVGVKNTAEAFDLFYKSLWRPDFRKSLGLNGWSERQLLPLVRTFLLGYFGESLVPEASSALPGALSGNGRIDFVIGDIAVEFVVRRPFTGKNSYSLEANKSEIKKLLKHDGHALLVLFDLSRSPLNPETLDEFRHFQPFGRGNHKKSPYNIAYYYRKNRPLRTEFLRMSIRA